MRTLQLLGSRLSWDKSYPKQLKNYEGGYISWII